MLGNYPMMGLNGTKYSNLLTNLSKIIKIVSLGIFKLTRNIQNNYDLHVMIWFFILKKKIGKCDKLFWIFIVHVQNLWQEYKSWPKITKKMSRSNHGVFLLENWLQLHFNFSNEIHKVGIRIMNNSVFFKSKENMRKHKEIKQENNESNRNYLTFE